MTNRIYFPNLNGLRFFAAFSVMISHFWGAHVMDGHYGVVLFFVLSGFLITYLLLEESERNNSISIKKFYIRRILRIWPIYFFIIFLSFIIGYYASVDRFDINQFFKALPFYIFFTPNIAFVLGYKIVFIDMLWSVGSEEQFYLFWPWLVKKFKSKLKYIFLVIILLFLFTPYLLSFISNYLTNGEFKTFLYYAGKVIYRMGFNSMATGALLAYIYRYRKDWLRFIFSKFIQVFVIVVALLLWILHPNIIFPDQTFAVLFGIIIINFAVNPNPIFSLENKMLNYLGKISYGLYVYHLVAFYANEQLFLFFNLNQKYYVIQFISGVLLTILISSISYKYFESIFLKIKLKNYSLIQSGS